MSSSSTLRRGSIAAIAAAMAGALVAAIAPTTTSVQASAAEANLAPLSAATAKLVPDTGALWGAAAGPRGSEDRMQAFENLENKLGVHMNIHRIYSKWDDKQPSGYVKADLARGTVPALSIIAHSRRGGAISWRSIANGNHDAAIIAQADGLKSTGKPIMLGFHHEPEDDPQNGSPADFIAAYRHYVEVFRARGADNVSFSWILMAWSFHRGADSLAAKYYPGDAYVDWIAVDGYNQYSCQGNKWRSMGEVLADFRAWATPHRKPVFVAEFGTQDMPGQPNAKAEWLRETTRTFQAWPEVKAVTYYDSFLGCGWFLEDRGAYDAYADMGRALKSGGPVEDPDPPAPGLPVIDGAAVSRDGETAATVTANVAAGAGPVKVSVDYGTTRSFGSTEVISLELPAGTTLRALETRIDGLEPNTAYYFRVVVEGAHGSTASRDLVLTAPEAPDAPIVKGARAANPTGTTVNVIAKLRGEAGATRWHVEYGTTARYGDSTEPATLAEDRGTVSTTVSGLEPGTTYHFRVVLTSGGQTVATADRTFRTVAPPKATNKKVERITHKRATYTGMAWLRGQSGKWWIEYGTTPNLSKKSDVDKLSGNYSGRELRQKMGRLAAGTRYYVRAVVKTNAGVGYGKVRTFTTDR